MSRRAIVAALALFVVLATPGGVAASHPATQSHTTATDFSAGSFEGNVSVEGTGESATLVMGTTEPTTTTFSYTGSQQTLNVPNSATNVTIEAWGAGGGAGADDDDSVGGDGAPGAYAKANFTGLAGETLYIYVGGQGADASGSTGGDGGFNGGGHGGNTSGGGGGGGGGGGMSDVRRGGASPADRIIVASGGGGGGGAAINSGADGFDGTAGQASSITGTGDYQGGTGSDTGNPGAGGGGGAGNNGGIGGSAGASNDDGGDGGQGGGSTTSGSGATFTAGGGNTGNGQVEVSYDGSTTATYLSANYSVTDSTGGYVNISGVDNVNATVTWEGWTGSSWTALDQSTGISTTGNKSFAWTQSTTTKVRVNVTTKTASGGGQSTLEIANEGVTFQTHAPTVDNASATPANGKTLDSNPATLSININDTDFGKAHGDTVTVDFYVNESDDQSFRKVGTDTLNANGTASTSFDISAGGNTSWYAFANDSYGHSQRSAILNFSAPSTIRILKEDNASELIDNATVELIFYFDDEPVLIESRNTTDGKINMAGLPINRPFVVSASADGFYTRRIYFEDLFQQQAIYLLNTSVQATQTTFTLRDFTGQYPPATTVLQIQRAINDSWQTVEGDFFGGVNEMTAQLRFNQRHRLIVRNTETGREKVYNALFSASSGEKVITITTGDVRLTETGARISIDPANTRLLAGNQTISAAFRNGSDSFRQYKLTIWRNDSGTRTVVATRSGALAGGETLAAQLNLSQNGSEVIEVNATFVLDDGTKRTIWKNYSIVNSYTQTGLLDVLATIPGRIGTDSEPITTLLAFSVSFMLGVAATRQFVLSTEAAGLVIVGMLSAFFLLGWVPVRLLFVAAMAWVVAAAIRRGL